MGITCGRTWDKIDESALLLGEGFASAVRGGLGIVQYTVPEGGGWGLEAGGGPSADYRIERQLSCATFENGISDT